MNRIGRCPPDVMPRLDDWSLLTRAERKRDAYGWDLHFREAWSDAAAALGPDRAASALQSVAMLNLKPDAVVGRRGRRILAYLDEHGFAPISVHRFRFGRHSMRELWRYDWHVYPVDRLRFSTFWYTSCDVLVLLLDDLAPVAGLPATTRLTALKGSSDLTARTPGQLRSVLMPPNPVLNFVHVADEPADLVRELGILLNGEARRAALSAIVTRSAARTAPEAAAALDALETLVTPHDLDVHACLARLASAPGADIEAVSRVAEHVADGTTLSWADVARLLGTGSARVDRWDLITVASSVLPRELDVPADALMPSVSVADWLRH